MTTGMVITAIIAVALGGLLGITATAWLLFSDEERQEKSWVRGQNDAGREIAEYRAAWLEGQKYLASARAMVQQQAKRDKTIHRQRQELKRLRAEVAKYKPKASTVRGL